MQRFKARYIFEFPAHGLFWVMMYYALQGLTGQRPFPYALVVLGFLVLLFYSCAFWLFKKLIRYKSSYVWTAAIAGWLLVIYGANYVLVWLLVGTRQHDQTLLPDRLAPPSPSPPARFAADWPQMQIIIALAFLAVLGAAAAYFFIREWMLNELARTKAEAVQLTTELRFLRSQVNPHFLFNTLNNLFSMALKEGKGSLADRIAKLSNMMRYMLYESDTDNVPLASEIECLKDYLTLHGMRYAAGEADVSFQYPDPAAISAVQVAPMIFIPFLENAFKYGVAVGEESYIAMTIAISRGMLVFTCENADHSTVAKPAAEKGGIGLENVKRRLELLYPGKHALSAAPQNGSYKVNLQIDLL